MKLVGFTKNGEWYVTSYYISDNISDSGVGKLSDYDAKILLIKLEKPYDNLLWGIENG